jgi:hypothetical protein
VGRRCSGAVPGGRDGGAESTVGRRCSGAVPGGRDGEAESTVGRKRGAESTLLEPLIRRS